MCTVKTLCNIVKGGDLKVGVCDIILVTTAWSTVGGSREQMHNTDRT